MNLQDLAKSEYYETLISWFQKEINILMQPENIPENDIADVKAYKRNLEFLQQKVEYLKRLRKAEPMSEAEVEQENDDEYE